MSAKSTKTKSRRSSTDWERLRRMSDRDIDYSDIPETDEKFWASARVFVPRAKTHLSVRLDEDVVDWFKRQGPGYQTRMNAVLRSYVQAVQSAKSQKR
ncbi:MAG: BrnA antitoxin family protein [Nitrospirae bacterium]|nr:MAG: BrnA antitoxin family protein [Nitrospirota bacterium]